MLLFRSEENIDKWCQDNSRSRGAVLSLDQVWHLAQRWYGDRLSADYTGRTVEQAEAIFQTVGLTGSFWQF